MPLHFMTTWFVTFQCDYLKRNFCKEGVQSLLSKVKHDPQRRMFLLRKLCVYIRRKRCTTFGAKPTADVGEVIKNAAYLQSAHPENGKDSVSTKPTSRSRRIASYSGHTRNLISMHRLAGPPWWKLSFKKWAVAINRARDDRWLHMPCKRAQTIALAMTDCLAVTHFMLNSFSLSNFTSVILFRCMVLSFAD